MVNWILEDGVFGSPLLPLIHAIQSQGHQVKVIDYTRGLTDYQHFFPADECILFYGSHYIAEQILGTSAQPGLSWKPGIIGTIAHYNCTHYYPYLQQWLLNKHHLQVMFILVRRLQICSR